MGGYGYGKGGKWGGYGKASSDTGQVSGGVPAAFRGSPYQGKGGKYNPPEPNTNLYVTGLPQAVMGGMGQLQIVDENYILEIFGQYGTIVECKVLQPRSEKQTRHALIRFATIEEAIFVKEGQDGFHLPGSDVAMTIDYAKAGSRDAGIDWQTQAQDVMERLAKTGGAWGSPPPFVPGAPAGGSKRRNHGGDWGAGEASGGGLSTVIAPAKDPIDDGTIMSRVMKGLLHMQWLPGQDVEGDDNLVTITGLPADCQEVHLYRILTSFGPIAPNGLKVLSLPDGTCRGTGTVLFLDPGAANAAAELLHGLVMPDGGSLKASVKKPKSPEEALFVAPWGVVGAGSEGGEPAAPAPPAKFDLRTSKSSTTSAAATAPAMSPPAMAPPATEPLGVAGGIGVVV